MNDKQQIRNLINRAKKDLTPDQREVLSASLLQKLESHPLFKNAKTVLLYYSLPDEVQTHNFIEKWYGQKRIILPIVIDPELELREYRGTVFLKESSFHIFEPVGVAFTDYASIDLALIPGIGFDNLGNRLGRGKGYYDKLLHRLESYNIYKIGICFDCQKINRIPTDSYDIPMNEVL